ncbi:MAG: hypothetical protein FD180_2301 [Planctomycetota bacterium]|nr:MAG: hypothetical protein FD180_2301 [Planctomycetota bacterium]
MRFFLFTLLLAAVASADALDEALVKAGLERKDLGWRPRGYWSRYPQDIPYKLRHFDDCLAEPLAVVNVARTLGNSEKANLDPAALSKPAEKSDGALYKAAFTLGVERKIGSFRAYSVNLTARDTDIVEALLAVQRDAGRPDRLVTFGNESPYPDYRKDLEKAAAAIPAAARTVLGRLILNALDAHHWSSMALRNVPLEKRAAACARLDIGVENTDGLDYEPAIDDMAKAWDEPSMWYAGLKCVQALDEARLALAQLPAAAAFAFDWKTPYGWVRVRGSGDDAIDASESFLIVDLGGKDTWKGPAGANDALRQIALALDCGGDDSWEADGPAQGAGLCGIGVLVDVSGNDTYRAGVCSQGFGQLGMGVLADLGGRDTYFVKFQGQGAAILGVGELLEVEGDDTYTVWCHGQGYGAAGGVGVLADRAGNDTYLAERDPAVTGRPSYHSELKVSVSEAQGCGMGRRGDGADGHSWAGGLGALLDASGDDTYTAGNWCMGTGYWFGTGVLWDGGGNDSYRGGVWSEATGAHFCIGAFVDEAGDDKHITLDGAANSIAFAHDFTVAVFVDAAGNDVYESSSGPGTSINRSFALLLDLGGDDSYTMAATNRPGMALFDEKFRDRSGGATYFADASSLGLFLDIGGTDKYSPDRKNDSEWLDDPGSPNPSVRNWSVGVDRAEGTVSLDPIPEKQPGK